MTQEPDVASDQPRRDGEVALPFDPSVTAADARVQFIGVVRSPWRDRAECPKNMADARSRGRPAEIVLSEPFWPGLNGLHRFSHVVILTWLDRSDRTLIVQKPRHATESKGVFALRSPARPNPIGLHVAKLVEVHQPGGRLLIDGIDVLDGTPVIDVKPYFASTEIMADAVPSADAGRR